MLSVHILAKDNVSTLSDCILSLETSLPLDSYELVVADCGSTDGTIDLCRRLDVKVVSVNLSGDISNVRNEIVSQMEHDWQFYLEPWEVLGSGAEHLYHRPRTGGKHMRFNVINEDLLSKPVRLWRRSDGRFVGPCFERVTLASGELAGIISSGSPNTFARDSEIVRAWSERSPMDNEPLYYRSCLDLSTRRFEDFMKHAGQYLFKGGSTRQSTVMSMYYMAQVECFRNKNAQRAIQLILSCIAANPLMAEFWCVLGDVHYHVLARFDKAASFYGNAVVLGSRRLAGDDWSMEISKYGEYPERMIESCRQIISASTNLNMITV